jgi:hypothetical protein
VEEYEEREADLVAALNDSEESLASCRIENEALQRDVEQYNRLYAEQNQQLQYSRIANRLELYHAAGAETGCVPKVSVGFDGLTRLAVTASVDEPTPLHVLVDGGYEGTLELRNGTERALDVELFGEEHSIDLVLRSEARVSIRDVRLTNAVVASDGFVDVGSGLASFDCEGRGMGRTLVNASAWRVAVINT